MMMEDLNNSLPSLAATPAGRSADTPPCYNNAQLLSADGLAAITHQGQRDRRRHTKAGKMFLTKQIQTSPTPATPID